MTMPEIEGPHVSSATSSTPYKIHTILLPSPVPGALPTPIATLLPLPLSTSLSNPATLPRNATPYPSSPSYEILNTPKKGFGMFATRSIKPGELILDEHPVLVVPERPLHHDSPVWDILGNDLPEKERKEMLTMANCRPKEECPSPVEGIVRTNALVLDLTLPYHKGEGKGKLANGDDAETHSERFGGVFLKINRCNHSCGPNAAHNWDVLNLSSKLYALRSIDPGEEITIFYTDVTQPRDVRRAELERNHRFLCSCLYCDPVASGKKGAHTGSIKESNETRRQLRHWLSTHPSYIKWSTDLCRADDTVTSSHLLALTLIEEEDLHFLQHIFIEELALCYAILGEEEEFRIWAQQFITKCGIEDPKRAEEFKTWLVQPRMFKKWGWRQKQRSSQGVRAPSPDYEYSELFS